VPGQVILAALLSVAALFGQAPRASDADVAAAIALGARRQVRTAVISACQATPGFGKAGAFDVTTTTHIGRIVFLAAEAAERSKPFALANVTEAQRMPAIVVSAQPVDPRVSDYGVEVTPPVTTIALRSKTDPGAVVHPTSLTLNPVVWGISDAVGPAKGTHAVATFSRDAFKALPAGDIDIVITAENGEHRCKIGQGDRERLGGKE
jgi:hypothetical protein